MSSFPTPASLVLLITGPILAKFIVQLLLEMQYGQVQMLQSLLRLFCSLQRRQSAIGTWPYDFKILQVTAQLTQEAEYHCIPQHQSSPSKFGWSQSRTANYTDLTLHTNRDQD